MSPPDTEGEWRIVAVAAVGAELALEEEVELALEEEVGGY